MIHNHIFMKKGSCAKLLAIFISLLFVCSSLALNGLAENSVTSGTKVVLADWTVMYYLCCDNHISYEADIMLDNLTKVGSSQDFNLIALKDGNEQGDSALYKIEEGKLVDISSLYGIPSELDMSNSNTMRVFLQIAMSDFPAKHYCLYINSDCGSGWIGVCHDNQAVTNKNYPLIPYPKFSSVLKDVTSDGTNKLDVIVYNPCVSQAFEASYELYPYVNYMVASEEHMLEESDMGPQYVLKYLDSTWELKNNTALSPEEFAKSFVDSYIPCIQPLMVGFYYIALKHNNVFPFVRFLSEKATKFLNNRRNPSLHIVSFHTTLSLINLSKTDAVAKAIDNLASLLLLNINEKEIINSINKARSQVREYGKLYPKKWSIEPFYIEFPIEKFAYDSFVDLYNLVQLINRSVENQAIKNACTEVLNKLADAVIANKAMPNDESYGTSIYFPKAKALYNSNIWKGKILTKYEELRFSQDTQWDEFLRAYLKF